MAPCGGMIGIARHEDDIYHGCHGKAGKGNPDCSRCLAGKLVPHRDIELHAEKHIGQQHNRHDADAGPEVPPQYEGNDIYIKDDTEEDEAAEGRKPVHDLSIEFP